MGFTVMVTFQQTLMLSSERLERVEALCAKPPGRDEVERDEIVHEWEVPVPHRMLISLQVVAPNEPDEQPCWCQAILFKSDPSGFVYDQVACSDVEDSLLGEWILEYDGRKYTLTVVKDPRSAGGE